MIKKIAEDNKLEYIDLQTPTAAYSNYFWDGVHPNKKGANLIASVILSYLKNNKQLSH
jgi:lysophospholipase L1-like esterase